MPSESPRILVLGAGGNVSVAILKALRASTLGGSDITGACVSAQAAGFAFCDRALIRPYADAPEFGAWLHAVESGHGIDLVLSGVEEILEFLSAHTSQGNAGAKYLVHGADLLERFNDKYLTNAWLVDNGLPAPRTLDLGVTTSLDAIDQALTAPFVVKPRRGKGSRGVRVLGSLEEAKPYLGDANYVAQEQIGTPDTEYTCGVYNSSFGYSEIIVLERELRHGSTARASVVHAPVIEEYCRRIAGEIGAAGAFNVQLRYCAEQETPYAFEINMRLSGTTHIRHRFGFRDCEAWACETFYDRPRKEAFSLIPGTAVRYEEEVFFSESGLRKLSAGDEVDVVGELLQ
jgi:carbamoyl-phosphate synthase large subunit